MQKEAGQYEIPPHRLQVTYEGKRLGDGKDLGEARIVHTLFGKAKVRVVRAGDPPGWLWPLFGAVALGGVAAAFWLWPGASPDERVRNAAPQAIAVPQPLAATPSPAASQPAQAEEPRRVAAASAPAVAADTESATHAVEPPVKAVAKPSVADETPSAGVRNEEAVAEPAQKTRKPRVVTPASETTPGPAGEGASVAPADARAKPSFSASPAVGKPARAAANPDETVHAASAQERGAATPVPADPPRPAQAPTQQP